MPVRKQEMVDVHQIMQEIITLFGQHRDIEFRISLDAKSFHVTADKEELSRGLINILKNSIQALEERGTIIIRTEDKAGCLDIFISDNGPGMPDHVKQHLFELNFSTKTDGMGLGLSLVKKTIEDIGGTIVVESEINAGTQVTLSIPLS